MRFFTLFSPMNQAKTILPVVLKTLLGMVFVVSAVLKILDMDKFEIYVYSYHFFSLNFSFLVARAAIILELVLGIGLVTNCFHKLMWWGSMAMLAGYTLLLIYAQVIGRTDNCHCFGDFLQFNPWQSILKNLVLLGLFTLVYRVEGWSFKRQRWALAGMVLTCCLAVFAVSPPDNFTPSYAPESNLQTEYFERAMSETPLDSLNLDDGKQIICFYSTACEYCQMAAHKLSLMQQYYGFPAERITCVFMGSKEGIAGFYERSGAAEYRNVLYEDALNLLKITNGTFPTLVFLQDGTPMLEFGFRNMREDEIRAFMIE